MRISRKKLFWILGVTFSVVALQFWMLVIVSTWLICDSYALDVFPKAHPLLGFVFAMLWNIGSIGGVYIMILALAAFFWWIARGASRPENVE